MNISRRSMLLALGALPSIGTTNLVAQNSPSVSALEIGTLVIASISPNGTTLMCRDDRRTLVFLQANTLEEISRSETVDEYAIIDTTAIAWHPDGNTVAFGLDAWVHYRDSDIFMADIATGEVTNTTAEGRENEAASLMNDGNVTVDVFPAWLNETTLLFGRHTFTPDMTEVTSEIASLDTSTGDITTWASLASIDVVYVTGPLHVISKNRVVFQTETNSHILRITIADQSGAKLVDTGNLVIERFVDVNDEHCLILELEEWEYMQVPHTSSGEPEIIRDVLAVGSEWFSTDPVYGPEQGTIAAIIERDERVILYDGHDVRQLGSLDGEARDATFQWVEGAVLVSTPIVSWLLPVD